MTTDQNSQIRGGHIKNQLTLITLVLIDRGISGIKETQQGAKDRDRDVSDGIELLVRKLLTSLVVSSDLGILANVGFVLLFKFFRHGTLHLLGT